MIGVGLEFKIERFKGYCTNIYNSIFSISVGGVLFSDTQKDMGVRLRNGFWEVVGLCINLRVIGPCDRAHVGLCQLGAALQHALVAPIHHAGGI